MEKKNKDSPQKSKYKIPEWLEKMPKTDLHCHLGGSMRVKTIFELAKKNNIKLPADNIEDLRNIIIYKNRAEKSLPSYLKAIAICESVLVNEEAFERTAYEVCEDAHAENVRIFELRFGPTNYVTETLKLHDIMSAVLRGLRKAAKDFDMKIGLIVCGIRTELEATQKAAEIASNFHNKKVGVVGFDLAGKENGHRPILFEKLIKPVHHNFIPVTIHAGEDDNVASIAEAIIYLNAQRIGHAISLKENPKLMRYIDQTRKSIEICYTSNKDTGVIASYETHPLMVYYAKGIRFSINTDNRTISNTNITKEYAKLMHYMGFKQKDIFQIAKAGIKTAFISSHEMEKYLNELDAFIAEYGEEKE
jgi:adenosine deaminase